MDVERIATDVYASRDLVYNPKVENQQRLLRLRRLDQRALFMTKVAILGASGYTAFELVKILLHHPAAEIVAATTRRDDEPALADLHPWLRGRISIRCEKFDADRLVARGV